jgi:hypothetical protein
MSIDHFFFNRKMCALGMLEVIELCDQFETIAACVSWQLAHSTMRQNVYQPCNRSYELHIIPARAISRLAIGDVSQITNTCSGRFDRTVSYQQIIAVGAT